MNNFSEKIITLRRINNVTQEKLSEIFKIPKRTIQDWEAEKSKPPEYLQPMILNYIYKYFFKKDLFIEYTASLTVSDPKEKK